MTVLIGGKHSLNLDASQFDILGFTAGTVTVATATAYRISNGTNFDEFTGSFTYDSAGTLIGGTITGWKRVTEGSVEFTATGFTLSVADFLADLTNADSAAFYAAIFGGNDKITGTSAQEEFLAGGAGNDTIAGGSGFDVYLVEDAGDLVIEAKGQGIDFVYVCFDYTLTPIVEDMELLAGAKAIGNDLANRMFGSADADTLIGAAGDDRLRGLGGDDLLVGGKGNDIYIVEDAGDAVTEDSDEGTDTIRTFLFNFTLDTASLANVENLTLLEGAANGTGNALGNLITGNDGDNSLDGGAGQDTLIGGKGDDLYRVDNSADKIIELAGAGSGLDSVLASADYVLAANLEELTLEGSAVSGTGNALDNFIFGNGAANKLFGLAGKDMILGGDGADTIDGGDGNDLLLGGAGDDSIAGGIGNDTLNGQGDDDNLAGGIGDDLLSGGDGSDTLAGGAGNDIYEITDADDTVVELAGQGTDSVTTDLAEFTLDTKALANVENLQATLAAFKGTGNSLNNSIKGNSADDTLDGGLGNDTLDGAAGADSLIGGKGNDTYFIDDAGDKVVENKDEGTDTVLSSAIDTSLGSPAISNVENLILLDGAVSGSGNNLNNVITGNTGNNTLEGFGGADTLIGGKGNDFYFVFDSGDKVIEAAGEGTNDTIQTLIEMVMLLNIETLVLDNSVTKGTGNVQNNRIVGRSNAAELLLGLGGDDNLSGDAENDTLDGGVGNDFQNGGADEDSLLGGLGNDTLFGGTGNDTLAGGAGDDTYIIESKDAAILELGGQGIDTIQTSLVDFTLDTKVLANVENLRLTGAASVGTGNSLNNSITGGSDNDTLGGGLGNDTLDGGSGADNMIGGKGDDTYIINDAGDIVIESANEGIDTIQTLTVTFSLDSPAFADIDNLTLLPGAVSGTGNNLNNVITGNSGFNNLSGLGGNDTMIGGDGQDFYSVDSAGDKIVELAGKDSGFDTVTATASYVLSANIERLDLGIGAIDGTGNASANVISGNDEANKLIGLAGNDDLSGSKGNDRLDGGTGNDTLGGGADIDTMAGGAGNNLYSIDNAADVVIEAAGQGIDTIETILTNFTLDTKALANVENLHMTFGGAVGTGNKLNNVIEGNDKANTLDGGLGNDTLIGAGGADLLIGGKGNDTFVVTNDGVTVTEAVGGGTDTVQSGVLLLDMNGAFENVENLIMLAGAGNAIGNGLANTMTGNGGNNSLNGGAGNDKLAGGDGLDTLAGGAGFDVMIGGKGDDTYIVNEAKDKVTELSGKDSGNDRVQSTIDYVLGANVEQLILLDGVAVNGTGNALGNQINGNDGANKLSGLAGNDAINGGGGTDTLLGGAGDDALAGQNGNDSMVGGIGNDSYSIDDAGDQVIEVAGQGIDTARVFVDISYTLAANVENLELFFGADGTGNAQANRIEDRFGEDNLMSGLDGNDTLVAAGGTDVMIGGAGRDTFVITVIDAGLETVTDFDAGALGDTLDLSDLLTGFFAGSSNPSDFVQFVDAGDDTTVRVDIDSAANGANFVDVCTLTGVTLTNINQAVTEGNLLLS